MGWYHRSLLTLCIRDRDWLRGVLIRTLSRSGQLHTLLLYLIEIRLLSRRCCCIIGTLANCSCWMYPEGVMMIANYCGNLYL